MANLPSLDEHNREHGGRLFPWRSKGMSRPTPVHANSKRRAPPGPQWGCRMSSSIFLSFFQIPVRGVAGMSAPGDIKLERSTWPRGGLRFVAGRTVRPHKVTRSLRPDHYRAAVAVKDRSADGVPHDSPASRGYLDEMAFAGVERALNHLYFVLVEKCRLYQNGAEFSVDERYSPGF